LLYAGGDHNEELGREEGAKKGARKVGTMGGVLGLELSARGGSVKFVATLARFKDMECGIDEEGAAGMIWKEEGEGWGVLFLRLLTGEVLESWDEKSSED
jgi:hypothetical protein